MKRPKPLIGYMIFESNAEDYSDWDGIIAYPNPQGANLAWENPIEMIEKSAYDDLKAKLDVARAATQKANTYLRDIAQAKRANLIRNGEPIAIHEAYEFLQEIANNGFVDSIQALEKIGEEE